MQFNFKKTLGVPLKFLREVRIEVKKVDWPRSREALRYSLIVVGGSLVFALFLGGIDSIFSLFLNRVIIS